MFKQENFAKATSQAPGEAESRSRLKLLDKTGMMTLMWGSASGE
jgi:hypothetical protein